MYAWNPTCSEGDPAEKLEVFFEDLVVAITRRVLVIPSLQTATSVPNDNTNNNNFYILVVAAGLTLAAKVVKRCNSSRRLSSQNRARAAMYSPLPAHWVLPMQSPHDNPKGSRKLTALMLLGIDLNSCILAIEMQLSSLQE